jgi:hypothetical protein
LVAVNGPTIEAQVARRPPTFSPAPADAPDYLGAGAAHASDLRALYPRRYALKNRERLTRLLMLMQLHINGDDDVQAYSKTIRQRLEANGGRSQGRRRAIADPTGSPSLR